MIKIILNGCNGKMGKVLQRMINEADDMQVAAGIDPKGAEGSEGFPVFTSPADCEAEADMVIDYSHFSAVPGIIRYCMEKKIALVAATTALDDEGKNLLQEAALQIPVFRTANTSIGINALIKAIKSVMPVLESEFNVEIVEKHHTQKVDSPSGTAILLADSVNEACETKKDYIYGRHGRADACKMTDLGIHAVRGGTIPGEHTVIFAGPNEVIEFTHTALSRDIFASGTLTAARFMAGKGKGLYSMSDVF